MSSMADKADAEAPTKTTDSAAKRKRARRCGWFAAWQAIFATWCSQYLLVFSIIFEKFIMYF